MRQRPPHSASHLVPLCHLRSTVRVAVLVVLLMLLEQYGPPRVDAQSTAQVPLDFAVTCSSSGQTCTPVRTVTVTTAGVLQVDLSFGGCSGCAHCSDGSVTFSVDSVNKYMTPEMGPLVGRTDSGLIDLGPVPSGRHTVGFQATGVSGGCNSGYLGSWGASGYLLIAPISKTLVFTVQPTAVAVNQPLTPAIRVAIQDGNGATVASATDSITLTLGANPRGAALTGTTTVTAVGGVATFSSLTLDKAGTGYTLAATDVTDSSTNSATSAPFDVGSRLQLAAPPEHIWANGHVAVPLTATVLDGSGNPLSGHSLSLSANPETGVGITATTPTTDSSGKAHFTVTSSATGTVTFTVSDAQQPGATATAQVVFARHKLLVEFLGIRTGLQCGGSPSSHCQVLSDTNNFDVNGFGVLDTQLIHQQQFAMEDVLWYSYHGGRVDSQTGAWLPHDYHCPDTAQDYRASIRQLQALLTSVGTANPNTDFYLVGHSQGGLIAYQALGLLGQLPATTSLKAVVTLDSPLGGAPAVYVALPATRTCWNGPANGQQIDLYRTATNHGQQGSTATILCGLLGVCSWSPADSNRLAATDAIAGGTQVATYGSTDDGVYNVGACAPELHRFFGNNTSSEVVSSAGGGLASLGGNITAVDFTDCISASHAQVYTAHAGDVATLVGAQSSVATAPAPP